MKSLPYLFTVILIISVLPNFAQNSRPTYHAEPDRIYSKRRIQYLNYCAERSSQGRSDNVWSKLNGIWSQIARLELGKPLEEKAIRDAIDAIY